MHDWEGILRRVAVAALALLFTATVQANTPPAEAVPMGPRFAKCYADPALEVPPCDFATWRSDEQVISWLNFLYDNQRFAVLDKALTRAAYADKRLDDGHHYASAAFWALRRMTRGPAPQTQHKYSLGQWEKTAPHSLVVPFARARFAYDDAWRVRGGGYGSSVSRESWELYGIRLNEAVQILTAAPAESRNSPLWHDLMLTVKLDIPGSDAAEVFLKAVGRWPDYYNFYHSMAGRLVPRWGGSWEAVDAFIAESQKHVGTKDARSMYSRLYSALHRQGYDPGETRMDWKTMKASFEDLVTRYPALIYKNRYASYACYARDKDAFSRAMRDLPVSTLQPDQWLRGHSYEACMRWAAL